MAIDQNPPTATDERVQAAIDNEIPAYRAISPGAIVSLVLGLASVFCFTDLWFLLLVAGSIVIGLLSTRKIRRLPEILTGANYARVGMALALVFGLMATTHVIASAVLLQMDASRFARHYAEVLKSQPVNTALWYQQGPDYRKTKNPDEVAAEAKKSRPAAGPDPSAMQEAAFHRLKERLRGQGQEIHFARIESTAVDGLTVYANALLDIDGPGSKEFPDKEEFALIEMIKAPGGGPTDWVVKDLRYPYKPASTVATVIKQADDGHGHSH